MNRPNDLPYCDDWELFDEELGHGSVHQLLIGFWDGVYCGGVEFKRNWFEWNKL